MKSKTYKKVVTWSIEDLKKEEKIDIIIFAFGLSFLMLWFYFYLRIITIGYIILTYSTVCFTITLYHMRRKVEYVWYRE